MSPAEQMTSTRAGAPSEAAPIQASGYVRRVVIASQRCWKKSASSLATVTSRPTSLSNSRSSLVRYSAPRPVSGGWFFYALAVDPREPQRFSHYPKFIMELWRSPAQNTYFLTMNLFSNGTNLNGVPAYALDRATCQVVVQRRDQVYSRPRWRRSIAVAFCCDPDGRSPPAGGMKSCWLLTVRPAATTLTQVHGRFFHVIRVPGKFHFRISSANQHANAEITVMGSLTPLQIRQRSRAPAGNVEQFDALGDKMMTPVVYQNHSGTESLWADSTVMENYPNGPTAVRWYRFDVTGGTFPAAAAQQQSWDNAGDGLWRWMPSIAVDESGNTVVGYSTSSTTIFPSIRYERTSCR